MTMLRPRIKRTIEIFPAPDGNVYLRRLSIPEDLKIEV